MGKKIYLGAAYYPEMWAETEIEADIARCKEAGVNTLRIAEFAWGKMEPREGEFQFDWLKNVVDKLYDAGISTVLCTPSATPPRWLLMKYPETRMVMHDLIRADVSSRCHTCKTSPVMREKNRIIVSKMAEIFAHHPGVVGWQIDNEIYPYSEGCYCDNCKSAFRAYLKEKYGKIDKLNAAWGMTRWSLTYDSFEDIEPPYPRQWRHPSLRKAWFDFQCAQIKSYVGEQADILHRYGCRNVGTDMMANNRLGYYPMHEKLDVVQFNHYNPAKDLPNTAFSYDFLRSVMDKPFWIMETQANWNGSEYADCGYRPVGNCYANTWLPVAKGAEMNLYWLFRAHPNGHELAHGALFSTSGRAYRIAEEVKRASDDFAKCGDFLSDTRVSSSIALHYSNTAVCDFETAPLLKDFHYRDTLVEKYYAAFRHFNVDVIDTPHTLAGYDVIISPFLACVDENDLKERIQSWVKSGGTWIVGPMSDIMNGDVSKYTSAPYSFLEEFAGVRTKYQNFVGNDVFKAKWTDGTPCGIGMCYDAYECLEGTKSLAQYDGDEFDGLSVVTERQVGKGKVILVGSALSEEDLLRLVAKKPVAEASENVILTQRSGKREGIIALESQNQTGYVVLDGAYTDLISGKRCEGRVELLPYQVCVLEAAKK